MSKKIFLCAINNILSGSCKEDCKFCTQSTKYKTDVEQYNYKKIEDIVNQAKIAKSFGAVGYCLVTAGQGLDDKKTNFIGEVAKEIKKEIKDINLIACNGLASLEQLKFLKYSGVDTYNHNLETSQKYYSEVCTTQKWEDRFTTCLNVKEASLYLCTGGIFGMGESKDDRSSLIQSLKYLDPDSITINFYHPNENLPIKKNINTKEAIQVIKNIKSELTNTDKIMVAGGRELMFNNDEQSMMFEAGANAIVIGNYLTTKGNDILNDVQNIKNIGYEIATSFQ